MRENCTYGLTRGRAYPARGALLYSTKIDTVAEFLDNARMLECLNVRMFECLNVGMLECRFLFGIRLPI